MDTDTQAQTSSPAPDRKALFFVIVTVILNTMGLTLIAPVAPFLVASYVSDPGSVGAAVGWLTSIYAICQFVAAPGLGALSDRFGRRPLLLFCLLGSAGGYLLLGIGGALWVLFLGRIIDGLTGANTSILIAYITDIVPSKDRARYFGLIGAIGALSIVVGPAIGGLLARLGYQVPFYMAGAVSAANAIYGLIFMPESLPIARRSEAISVTQLDPFSTLREVFSLPKLRWSLVALFLYTLATIVVPSNMGLFTRDILHWDADGTGLLFSVFGVVTILVQGVLLERLLKRLNAGQVTQGGLWFTVIAFVLVAMVALVAAVGSNGLSGTLLYAGIILFAVGDGSASPCLLEMITRGTDERAHGKVQGGSQSVQSVATIVGPLLAGTLYDHLGPASPYWVGVVIVMLAVVAVARALPSLEYSLLQHTLKQDN